MATVLVREKLGPGRAQDLQEMDFDDLPRKGDYIKISVGSVIGKFEAEGIIHEVTLGRKNKIVVLVKNMGQNGSQRPSQPPHHPQLPPQSAPALPAHETPQKPKEDLYYV